MKRGFSTVEIILSLALFMVLVLGLSSGMFYGLDSRKKVTEETKAAFLLDESAEILYNIKDSSYANLVNGTWGLVQNAGIWALGPSPDIQDGYSRSITISDIDGTNKSAEIKINWVTDAGNKEISQTIRLSDWERTIQTGAPTWDTPTLIGTFNITGTSAGLRVRAINNTAYVIINSTTLDMHALNYTNTSSVSSLFSKLSDSTGRLYDFVIDGNYLYGTSSSNTKEFIVHDISSISAPVQVSSLNLTGTANALGITKSGNYIFVTRASSNTNADPELSIINVTNPLAPTVVSNLSLGRGLNANDIAVSGNYAYIATSSNNAELTIVNISNLSAPTFTSALDLTNNNDGHRVLVNNGTVFLAKNNGPLHIVNVNNPNTPVQISVYNAGGLVGDMVLGIPNNQNLFLATANTTRELQVLDITNLASPTLLGSYNAASALAGIDYDPVRELLLCTGSNAVDFNIFGPTPTP